MKMNWKLPNQLTIGRIILAAIFFTMVGLYESGSPASEYLLIVSATIYIIAGITDILDGYLARKMNLTSAFGRIADPFVDKVLVIGAFVMYSGSNFTFAAGNVGEFEAGLPNWLTGQMASGVQSWMVVAMLAREFVVTGIRGYSESCGVKFPATYVGKFKMFVQSVAIVTILVQLAWVQTAPWGIITKLISVWLTVIVTVLSGLSYINQARGLLLADDKP